MTNKIQPIGVNKNFEFTKKINDDGVEYWNARELMPLLGYGRWENFQKVISKAINACVNSQQDKKDHFLDVAKMVYLGSGSQRAVKDYNLSRYACYLIAQNGDSSKIQIATAQTYFAVQTRKQEITEQITDDQKRLFIRKEVKDQNKKLFNTAKL
ncbi:MAG: DNA-damage-inducible protein D, partial [Candidatus Berkelbacteria bacterium Licking1014_85]